MNMLVKSALKFEVIRPSRSDVRQSVSKWVSEPVLADFTDITLVCDSTGTFGKLYWCDTDNDDGNDDPDDPDDSHDPYDPDDFNEFDDPDDPMTPMTKTNLMTLMTLMTQMTMTKVI